MALSLELTDTFYLFKGLHVENTNLKKCEKVYGRIYLGLQIIRN